ncbi:hypothetical protein OYC64_006515 [Pagothenia borchgrevinki]|uniref:Tumor necrosis factor receptor superfamily member 13C n=1 Tax=Pagothenia borchgrevinki TaxID=8213 RepID=A0ABD2GJI8_PAGBO
MVKKDCPAGEKWDRLVDLCVSDKTETRPEPGPTTEPALAVVVQLRATAPAARAPPLVLLGPALWIVVVLATLGSILAVTLWFIIYRRQTRHSGTSEEAAPQQPLQKTEPLAEIHPPPPEMFQRAAWTPSPCPHQHPGARTGCRSEQEGFTFCSGPSEHAWPEGPNMLREHRVPLPATELGGTALVTTKTM